MPQKKDLRVVTDFRKTIQEIGQKRVLEALQSMLLIRNFEVRGESAYQHGLIGGFYHSYSGQEAIQTACVQVFGKKNWYVTTYRCHALALLLGADPQELMAELYGKKTGNAKGRGGSMHLYADRLLGGFAIVGGHLPIAAGAAFSIKYLQKEDEVTICFLGDGAVAQGPFHETLNLVSLWNLPVIFVIENNHWGMGTHVSRAVASYAHIAESFAPAYNMKGYSFNGMNYFESYQGFQSLKNEIVKTRKPILAEFICERFRGHSISDPGLYRTKEELKDVLQKDPIASLRYFLEQENWLTEEQFKEMDKKAKETVVEAMKYAEESPWPSPATLEEDVYAP